MTSIPDFWDTGPHEPLEVEATWDAFVRAAGGCRVTEVVSTQQFENADYLFHDAAVIAELKEIQKDFTQSSAFRNGYHALLSRVVSEDPTWRPVLFGGDGKYPAWFSTEFLRLFRPPLSRTLKKANRQIRETKTRLNMEGAVDVLFLVNDGFTAIGPDLIRGLCARLLIHSYSSIECLVYVTLNRYIEIRGSDTPRLMWAASYGEDAPDSLVDFVDQLGRQWRAFLHTKIGTFTHPDIETSNHEVLRGAKAIVLPRGDRGYL